MSTITEMVDRLIAAWDAAKTIQRHVRYALIIERNKRISAILLSRHPRGGSHSSLGVLCDDMLLMILQRVYPTHGL